MKNMRLLLLLAVAALTTMSCTKDNSSYSRPDGKVILVTDSGSAFDTKASYNGTTTYNESIRHRFVWDANDVLGVYSFNQVQGEITPWGAFTSGTPEGGKTIFVGGQEPDSYIGSDFIALYCNNVSSYKLFWNSTRYDFGFNIPAEQDGTGVKYSLFAGKPTYDSSTKKMSMPTSGSYQFFLRTALTLLNVPASADVRRITVTATTAKNGAAQNLASSGDKQDVYINSSSFGIWGAATNTITIYNNNEVLSDNVFFASRQVTTGNATNGYILLTFVFTNGSGETATKVVKLGASPQVDGTATTYYKINSAVVNNLGSVTFNPGDFI